MFRYGHRKDVRTNMFANFGSTGVMTGPISSYYKSRLQEFLSLREKEDHPTVIQWLDDYIEVLRIEVENAQIREEREL